MKREIRKAVVAVMLAREHLPFIEGWCEHHLAQGFTVHLYDNTGSTGSARRTSSFAQKPWVRERTDKRKRPYGRYTELMTDEEVSRALSIKLARLQGVTVERWQPVVDGRIVHGQVEAYADFIRRFRGEIDWAAFIDCDEYLEARGGWGWDELLAKADESGRVRILGDSWECRWNEDGTPRHINELRLVEPQGTGGVKNLVKLSEVEWADLHSYWQLRDRDWCHEADPKFFGFRHHANPRVGGIPVKVVPAPGRNGESVRVANFS